MAITLTVTDNLDGTGATATVLGAGALDAVYVYAAIWTGQMGSLTWVEVSSRGGPGVLNIVVPGNPGGLGLGYYIWIAKSDPGGGGPIVFSNPAYRRMSDSDETAVWFDIMESVAIFINGIGLDGIASINIFRKWFPMFNPKQHTYPRVVIAPVGAEDFPGTLTTQDDVGYPVAIALCDSMDFSSNQDFLSRNLLWRQKISRGFRFQTLAGLPRVYTANPVPDVVINPEGFDKNIFFSAYVFRFVSREDRGLNA